MDLSSERCGERANGLPDELHVCPIWRVTPRLLNKANICTTTVIKMVSILTCLNVLFVCIPMKVAKKICGLYFLNVFLVLLGQRQCRADGLRVELIDHPSTCSVLQSFTIVTFLCYCWGKKNKTITICNKFKNIYFEGSWLNFFLSSITFYSPLCTPIFYSYWFVPCIYFKQLLACVFINCIGVSNLNGRSNQYYTSSLKTKENMNFPVLLFKITFTNFLNCGGRWKKYILKAIYTQSCMMTGP